MFSGSDIIVVAIAIIALGIFVWHAVVATSKSNQASEEPARKRHRKSRVQIERF